MCYIDTCAHIYNIKPLHTHNMNTKGFNNNDSNEDSVDICNQSNFYFIFITFGCVLLYFILFS